MQIHHISDHGLYLFISVKGKNKIRNMLRLHSYSTKERKREGWYRSVENSKVLILSIICNSVTLKLENIDYKLRLKNAVTNIAVVESDP